VRLGRKWTASEALAPAPSTITVRSDTKQVCELCRISGGDAFGRASREVLSDPLREERASPLASLRRLLRTRSDSARQRQPVVPFAREAKPSGGRVQTNSRSLAKATGGYKRPVPEPLGDTVSLIWIMKWQHSDLLDALRGRNAIRPRRAKACGVRRFDRAANRSVSRADRVCAPPHPQNLRVPDTIPASPWGRRGTCGLIALASPYPEQRCPDRIAQGSRRLDKKSSQNLDTGTSRC